MVKHWAVFLVNAHFTARKWQQASLRMPFGSGTGGIESAVASGKQKILKQRPTADFPLFGAGCIIKAGRWRDSQLA